MKDEAIEIALDVFYPYWKDSDPRRRVELVKRMNKAISYALSVEAGKSIPVIDKQVESWKRFNKKKKY